MTSKLIVNSVRHTGASADAITLDSSGNVTFPGNATCSGSTTGFGKILQVVSFVNNAAASVALSNVYANNNSYIYYISSMDTAITTTQANSKILISFNIFGEASVVDNQIGFVVSSTIGGTTAPIDSLRGLAYGDRARVSTMMNLGNHTGDNDSTPSTTSLSNLLYSPSQSSGTAITINIGVVAISSTGTFYMNRTVFDGNGAAYEKGSSCVTLMEVAA
tara:strand:- start:46 stop:702 length:657 start_codon:yes stop_codon:yes gene_type:complete